MKSKRKSNLLTGFFKDIKLVQVLLATIFVASILFFSQSLDSLPSPSNKNYATLVINLEEGRRIFEGEVTKNMTILDTLNASATAGNINFKYLVKEDESTYVKEINGYSNIIKKFAFFVNSREVKEGDINKIMVSPGDRVEVRFK